MNDALTSATENPPRFPAYLFRFTGRISPGQYFVGLASAIAVLVAALFLVASASMPTGSGGGAIPGIVLVVAFLWIVLAVMVQRLRDAGKSPALALVFFLGPMLVMFLGVELIETAGVLLVLISLAFITGPAFLKQTQSNEVAAPQ